MPLIDVVNLNNEKIGEVELLDSIYNVELRQHLVHEVVTAQLASARSGNASTKTRAEVSFSNVKPYRQKGTGRARAGTRRSPIWRHGGITFGPKPRDYSYRPPLKVRREALRIVLTAKVLEKELTILENFTLAEIKTKKFVGVMNSLGLNNAIVIVPARNAELELASRNLQNFRVMPVEGLNCYDVLLHHNLVILKDCLGAIEERLNK